MSPAPPRLSPGRRRATCLVLGTLLLAAACGGRQGEDSALPRISDSDIAQVESCEAMLHRLRNTQVRQRSAEALDELIEEALALHGPCEAAYQAVSRTPMEMLYNRHRADQLVLQTLFIEAEASRLHHESAGYCMILADAFRQLLAGVGRIEEGLRRADLTPDEARQLNELRTLDLQAIDVLFINYEGVCGAPPGQP